MDWAAEAYAEACDASDPGKRLALVTETEGLIEKTRQTHTVLGQEFRRIWLRESKPYALDWTMKRYADLDARYQALGERVADGAGSCSAVKSCPRRRTSA